MLLFLPTNAADVWSLVKHYTSVVKRLQIQIPKFILQVRRASECHNARHRLQIFLLSSLAFLTYRSSDARNSRFLGTNFGIENSLVSTLTPKIYFENIFFDESSNMMTFTNVLHPSHLVHAHRHLSLSWNRFKEIYHMYVRFRDKDIINDIYMKWWTIENHREWDGSGLVLGSTLILH